MGGLDPQTAVALGIAGVVATVLASLIAGVFNLIGQWIQRGTARQVAQIQAEAQRDLERRKATREYREQLARPVREMAVGRHALWLKLASHARARGDAVGIAAILGELQAADSQVPPGYGDALNADVRRELEAFRLTEAGIRNAFIESVERKEAPTFAAAVIPQLMQLDERTAALHRAIERYVLGSPEEETPQPAQLPPAG